MSTFTNSEIRAAILKAADQIEKHPDWFRFMSGDVPQHPCGTPGCALGWIGHFIGPEACRDDYGFSSFRTVAAVLDIPAERLGNEITFPAEREYCFYNRMDERCKTIHPQEYIWRSDASICAETMRLYADKYHPADKPVSGELPDAIKRIFAGEVLA